MKYNYPNPCDSCAISECRKGNGCAKWQVRFLTIWKQFNTYQMRQYRKDRTHKKFCYEHPDLIHRYLKDGPCKGCQFEALCDVPCTAYWCWWDARMEVLKRKYGTE